MNNKGMILVLSLFIILILAVLSSSFLYKQVNQSYLSNRYADSVQALWAAEGGLQAARDDNLDQSFVSGTLGSGSYLANITRIGTSNYYEIVSRGTAGGVVRTVKAVVSTRDVDASKFKYGLESNVDIQLKGASTVWGENTTQPVPPKTHDPDYYKENSIFSFADLFGFSTTEIRGLSTVYNQTFPSGNFTGINWVIAPGSKFTGDVYGSGILIVEGDFRIAGTVAFDGIIYVIGELDMSGTSFVSGAILAESAANVDTTVTGTADIEHNTTKIQTALDNVAYRSPRIVSWQEAR
ncbi:MAG: hypothetical protein PHT59_02495 [Candidatus Omnitrophica bacterium]|nr:hypothetical protein [Candidatus Omnitrophota bacterium]